MKTNITYKITLVTLLAIITLGMLTQDASAIGRRRANKESKECVKTEQRDPAKIREQMREKCETRLKKALKVTDEEWKEISPYFDEVRTLKRKLNSLTANPRREMAKRRVHRLHDQKPRLGKGEKDCKSGEGKLHERKGKMGLKEGLDCREHKGQREHMKVFKPHRALEELRLVVEDETATTEEIAERLENLRKTREETAEKLAIARKKLAEKLNTRQQAVLAMLGILE